ncbi:secretion protein HlyD family protein [Solidesulfovibrio carbinoliphilus subsp. oakridgensis]|uniref:Secretion protein HlyD family protein n=1 Tax=Solidesulfovibrio carbinoliphilus subsp. oakridgensis TaxID=694327 RepID=G7QAW5_9BACT|nr:HlyD family secretion protein [Solidesulfovibrio carbinoliphilus]EHJ48306.1 secretion protein HlyD family protein [Solidesulfovibrio carbinoliphilus subsp. oakridgensis]
MSAAPPETPPAQGPVDPAVLQTGRPAGQTPPPLPPRRHRPLWRNPWVLLLAACLLAGALAYWRYDRQFESTDDAFIAGHVTAVSAQVPGRVKEVLVDDNQKVAKGDVVLRIDPADYQVRLDQARAALATARRNRDEAVSEQEAARAAAETSRAQVASELATAENADKEKARYDKLASERVVAQEARDNADTTARTARAALDVARKKYAADQTQVALAGTRIETAKAQVEEARAAVDKAALDLAHTEVHARVSGRVTNKAVEPGDYIQTGQNFLSLVNPDIWVVANFKETQLTRMRPGQPVAVTVDTYPDREIKAHVESVQRGTGAAFSLLPPENATGNYVKVVQRVPVKIVFDRTDADQDMLLAPGMSVVPTVRVR